MKVLVSYCSCGAWCPVEACYDANPCSIQSDPGRARLARQEQGQDMEVDEPLRLRVEAELREQGLSVAIDPTSISRIAALLGAEDGRKREKRLAVIRQRLTEMEVRWKPADRQEL
jgi:hypothetical protein